MGYRNQKGVLFMYNLSNYKMIDLHSHSSLSDGVLSPEELIELAIKSGLKVLAITDHNCINKDLPYLQNKYQDRIVLPSGCEFSCGYKTVKGRLIQIHLGAILFDIDNPEIQHIIEYNNLAMIPYIERILGKLKNCGIELGSYDELLSASHSISVGRRHIAVEMVNQKIVKDTDEAFNRFLSEGKPAYVSNATNYADLSDIVHAVVKSNGIIGINHLLKYNLSLAEIDGLLKEFKQLAGNQGALEVYYSAYNDEQQFFLHKLAQSYGLLESCGSDYHGHNDSKIKDLGDFPYEIYDKIVRASIGLPFS